MSDKLSKIVEARLKLKARFEALERHKEGEGTAPAPGPRKRRRPKGSGPPNRHGQPQVPPGQIKTKKWPVLDLGQKPEITPESFRLVVDGACEEPLSLSWQDLMALPQVDDVSDFHCVTTWSKLDVPWRGVRFADVAALAMPVPEARFVMCYGSDGYSTNLPLADALSPDVLLAHTVFGEPLPVEHGGPLRMITPRLYAWKGSKWLCRIEFMVSDRKGFWEERGYSNTADPWKEERYS